MDGIGGAAVLVLAGIVAGVIGTSGGITSLVAYPALLVAGLPPLAANVTGSVALLGSGLSSALGSRRDVAGSGRVLRRWLPPIALGSTAGAVLLVVTPAGVFDRVVPFLVATGSIVLLLQPVIARWLLRRGRPLPKAAVVAAGTGIAVYNGYFGAGAGILLIALLLLTAQPVLHRANALKNVILVAADALPAVLFALAGPVVWRAMWPLAIGAVAGDWSVPSSPGGCPPRCSGC
ncbi:sulfite exporter TauE/SafE family protein [Amnibacterium kyonggiense]